MVDDAVLEYIYLEKQKLKSKFKSIIILNQSDRLTGIINSWKESIQIIIHVFKFLFEKLCKCNVLYNPSSPQIYDRPHYSFRCNIEYKNITWIYISTRNAINYNRMHFRTCIHDKYWLPVMIYILRRRLVSCDIGKRS